jgi:hypothetical protein
LDRNRPPGPPSSLREVLLSMLALRVGARPRAAAVASALARAAS